MGAAAVAGGASIAALGLSAAGSVMKGEGTQAADEFQAAHAERAAEFGRAQADLTDATLREKLNVTLGNIDVIRAAAHIDPSSPTTTALLDFNSKIAERQRLAAVGSINAQTAEDEASARYLHSAGDFALMQGYIGAGVDIAGGVAKGFTSGTFGGGNKGK